MQLLNSSLFYCSLKQGGNKGVELLTCIRRFGVNESGGGGKDDVAFALSEVYCDWRINYLEKNAE